MKIDKMIPQFTKDEIEIIAQTFSTYRFENNEEGLYYKCKGEKGENHYPRIGITGWETPGEAPQTGNRNLLFFPSAR